MLEYAFHEYIWDVTNHRKRDENIWYRYSWNIEVRWKRAGQIHLTTGELILYSGHMDDNAVHSEGVAIMISKEAQRTLIG